MSSLRILIAGIGNIFLGDDAFGVEVAQRLAQRRQAEGVRVVDFGIRGLDLTYALLDGCDVAILVDAAPCGHAPGTLYVIEPETGPDADAENLSPGELLIETHGMNPTKVLRLIGVLGGQLKHILLVGCEPSPIEEDQDDMRMSLSLPVQAAVDEAIILVESLVDQIRAVGYEAAVAAFPQQSPKGELHHGNAYPPLEANGVGAPSP